MKSTVFTSGRTLFIKSLDLVVLTTFGRQTSSRDYMSNVLPLVNNLSKFWVFLYFVVSTAIFSTLWFFLLSLFIKSAGFYNPEPAPPEPPPVTYLNTYADADSTRKNFVINNSRNTNDMTVRINAPLTDDDTYRHSWLYYQYERWLLNATIYDSQHIERPRWDTDTIRLPNEQPTSLTTPWFVEVADIKSHFLHYSYTTPISTTDVCYSYIREKVHTVWYDPIPSFWAYTRLRTTFTTTITDSLPAYRVMYGAPQMTYKYVDYGDSHHRYNFQNFEREFTMSQWFPDYRGVPARSNIGDRILANGTKDNDIILIYAFRYYLGTDEGPKFLEGLANITKSNGNLKGEAMAFSIELLNGLEPRYMTTTTTSTFKPQFQYQLNQESMSNLFFYMKLGIAVLLLMQVPPMSVMIIVGLGLFSELSYLEARHENYFIEFYITWVIYPILLAVFLADTGLFGYIACKVKAILREKKNYLIVSLCVAVSAFTVVPLSNNVATIIFMTPVAIRCCEEFNINPVPVLVMMIIYANEAGILTSTSSAASYSYILIAGYKKSMILEYAIMTITTTIYFVFVMKYFRLLQCHPSRKITALKHDAKLWKMVLISSDALSGQSLAIRQSLQARFTLTEQQILAEKERLKNTLPAQKDGFKLSFRCDNCIKDKVLLVKIAMSVLVYIVILILRGFGTDQIPQHRYRPRPHGPPRGPPRGPPQGPTHSLANATTNSLMWLAICTLLIIVNPNFNRTMRRLDWTTISNYLMFNAINIMLIQLDAYDYYVEPDRPSDTAILWSYSIIKAIYNHGGFGIGSKLIRNHPETAHAFIIASTIGGSATLLGTFPSIACANSAAQQGYKIGYFYYLAIAFPITFIRLVIITLLFI